ncbi:MAG: response regulator [Planctomycetota bacterium]
MSGCPRIRRGGGLARQIARTQLDLLPREQLASAIREPAWPPAVRLFVVDDDEQIRALLVRILARVGIAAQGLPSGKELLAAVAQLSSGERVAALLDVSMPGLDGPTTAAELRRSVAIPSSS